MLRTRLDPVVRLRERDEKLAHEALAKASAVVRVAREGVAVAEASMARDERRAADAAEWAFMDAAHERAVTEYKAATQRLSLAVVGETTAREKHTVAHGRTEAVRRVADARRAEQQQELDKAERKAMDEVASLLFWHQPR